MSVTPVRGGRVLGHDLVETEPTPSGWWANCECGSSFYGRWQFRAIDAWRKHTDEEAENRG